MTVIAIANQKGGVSKTTTAAAGQAVTQYDPGGKVSEAYKLFTRKVMQWLKRNQP